MKTFLLLLCLTFPALTFSQQSKTIQFESGDGLMLTADVYMPHPKTAPFIVLFHQARWSRGEYLEIAPKLNLMGFNCMAVDLRSGGQVNGVKNQSFIEAQKKMKPTEYVDAYPDIDAAVTYVKEYYAKGALIIWGSSYSSALVLKYTGDHPNKVAGVLSFSPGEYFHSQGKSNTWITESAAHITQPVFITSAKGEKSSWQGIFEAIPSKHKTSFLPTTAGNHGARALWSKFGDSVYYWNAVEQFLTQFN